MSGRAAVLSAYSMLILAGRRNPARSLESSGLFRPANSLEISVSLKRVSRCSTFASVRPRPGFPAGMSRPDSWRALRSPRRRCCG